MSIPLTSVDLTGSIVGSKGKISLNNVGVSAGGPSAHPSLTETQAHLLIYNESGFGLLFSFPSGGTGIYAPAGAWFPLEVPPGQNELDYTVLYILSSAAVSLLLVTYFAPGEPVKVALLGNSPIAGGGVTSNVSTLVNEGNSPGSVEVIDIGDTSYSKLIDIFNNGAMSLAVNQSGVKHFFLVTSASGTPLKLGQNNDVTEVEGFLNVLQQITLPNNISLNMKDSGGTGRSILFLNTIDETTLRGITGTDHILVQQGDGTGIAFFGTGGFTLQKGSINLLAGAFARLAGANNTSCGSGTTITHGLGATPGILVATPFITQAGSATVGVGNIGATTFQATVGAGTGLDWLALA